MKSFCKYLLAPLVCFSNVPLTCGLLSPDPSHLPFVFDTAPLQHFAASYNHALAEDPIRTKVLTGMGLAVVGDGIAQAREPAEYNVKRASSFAAFDAFYRGVQMYTYPPMMQACSGQFSLALLTMAGLQGAVDTHFAAALEQTLVSQLVIIPTIYYPVFYAVTGAVQGLTFDETIQRAKDTFVPLMKRNLLFWIPVQFGTFAFVEENMQIPILIVCGLVWTIILSIVAGAVKAPTPVEEEELVPAFAEGVVPEDAVYCVTGMEEECLIDPDNLFEPPHLELPDMDMDSAGVIRSLEEDDAVTQTDESFARNLTAAR